MNFSQKFFETSQKVLIKVFFTLLLFITIQPTIAIPKVEVFGMSLEQLLKLEIENPSPDAKIPQKVVKNSLFQNCRRIERFGINHFSEILTSIQRGCTSVKTYWFADYCTTQEVRKHDKFWYLYYCLGVDSALKDIGLVCLQSHCSFF